MNEQLISEIVSPKANEQLNKLTKDVAATEVELQKAIITAKLFTDTLSGAKGFAEFNRNSANAAKAQEDIAKKTAARQLTEERLASFRAAEQAKSDARAKKEEENLAKIEAANNKAAEAARKRARIVSESTAEDIARSSGGTNSGNNTGATVNTTNLADANAANEATRAYNKNSSSLVTNTAAAKGNAKAKAASILTEAQATAATAANNAAIKRQAVEMIAAKGSLDQRQAALVRLTAAYSALNVAERTSAAGIRLGTRILPGLNAQVSALRATTTGAAASTSLLSGSFGALRTLANILPGIGIAGLIAFATGPIIEYIGKLNLFKKATSEAKATQETLTKALSGNEYADAVTNINELRINIDAAKKGFVDKSDVLKQYNDTIGKTTGQVKSLDEAERELNKNADAFVKFTLYKAAAQLALEDAAKKSYEAEISRRKRLEEFSSIGENFGPGNLEGIDTRTGEVDFKKRAERQKRLLKQRQDRQNAEIKISEDEAKKQLTIADKFQKDALQIAKANGFTNPLGLREDKKSNTNKVESDARKQAASLIQIQIDFLKEAQDYYKQNLDNQNFSLEGRLEGLKNFSDVSLEIAKLEGDREKAAKKLTSNEILAIDSETASKQNKIRLDQSDKAVVITKQGLERIRVAVAEQAVKDLTDSERLRDIELASLTNALNKGTIGQTEYDEKRRIIENDYTQFYIELQIKQTQALIDEGKKRGENVESEEAKLAGIKLKYLELFSKKQKQANDDLEKEAEELAQNEIDRRKKVDEITQELFNFGKALGSATFTRRINEIEREKTALTEKTALEISNTQASTASESEKADRIAIINARAASDQAILDEKVKQQKIKQARFDKAASIASIIMNTAVAVTKTLAVGLGFFSSPLAILTAALGAAQLATVLATPIPEYKTGKSASNNYSGPAWVGDGGMNELVIEKNGSMWVTPNKPTLTTVGKDTQVVSGPDFKRMLAKPRSGQQSVGSVNIDISQLVSEQRQTRKAIGKQSVNAIVVTEKGAMAKQVKTERYNKWVTRNFRG